MKTPRFLKEIANYQLSILEFAKNEYKKEAADNFNKWISFCERGYITVTECLGLIVNYKVC